jgi:hypothetical protein
MCTLDNTPFLVHYPFQPLRVRLDRTKIHHTVRMGSSLAKNIHYACMYVCIYHI